MARSPGQRNSLYNPQEDMSGKLFNHLQRKYLLRTEVDLAAFIEMSTSNLSKIRHGTRQIGPGTILHVHEKTGMPVKEIRRLIALSPGDPL